VAVDKTGVRRFFIDACGSGLLRRSTPRNDVFAWCYVIARAEGPWRSTAKRIKSSAVGAKKQTGFGRFFVSLRIQSYLQI
jgi:hypothetical protein